MPVSPRPTPAAVPAAVLVRRVLASAAVVAVAAALTACSPEADAVPPGQPVASETPSAPSDDASPEPTPTRSSAPEELSMSEQLDEALTSGHLAPVENFLTEPTRVVIAASEADIQYGRVDAVLALDYVRPGEGAWDFELETSVVDGYAGNPYYGEFFPDDAVVGLSHSGAVVSFVPNGDRIGTIFMAAHESLLTDY